MNLAIHPHIYYTPEEVAALLRVSPQNVQSLLETGVARSVRIGGNYRVLGRDLLHLPDASESPTRTLLYASQPVFNKVWDNDEDAVYDDL